MSFRMKFSAAQYTYSDVTPALLILQAECLGNETRPDILTMAQATRYARFASCWHALLVKHEQSMSKI